MQLDCGPATSCVVAGHKVLYRDMRLQQLLIALIAMSVSKQDDIHAAITQA